MALEEGEVRLDNLRGTVWDSTEEPRNDGIKTRSAHDSAFFSSPPSAGGSVQLPLVPPFASAPPRVPSISSLIADQLVVYAQTAPFLVQNCNYETAQGGVHSA